MLGALLLLSHFTHPQGTSHSPALAAGGLQVLPLSGGAGSLGRLQHRDQASVGPVPLTRSMDLLVPRAGALVRHSSFLSSVRTKARTIKGGGKSLPCLERSNYWVQPGSVEHREGPRRLLSTGLTPRAVPLHVAISTSAGPGAVPWLAAALVPLSCSRALGSAGLRGSALHPGHWAVCPTVQPQLQWYPPGCGSAWDRTAVWWLLTTQT